MKERVHETLGTSIIYSPLNNETILKMFKYEKGNKNGVLSEPQIIKTAQIIPPPLLNFQ